MENFCPKNFLILIIDDNDDNLKILQYIVEEIGYNTITCTDAKHGLKKAQETCPDLILLDLMMPNINGFEYCNLVKNIPHLKDIPIIFITASCRIEDLTKAFAMGAVDYLTKPFNQVELLSRVKTHLKLQDTTKKLKQALAQVKRLAETDVLTGIYNRRYFLEYAEKIFNQAKLKNSIFSIIIIDLDHFKKINDTYGHQIGDLVLKEFVARTQKIISESDCFARFGGEEFIILLQGVSSEVGLVIANTIQEVIDKEPFLINSHAIFVTVSLGGSTYEKNKFSLEQMINQADNALYESKKQGRNQVRWI